MLCQSLTTAQDIKAHWLKIGYQVVKSFFIRFLIDIASCPGREAGKYKVSPGISSNDSLALLLFLKW